jgi:anti-anti-sigma regulatory factor
MKQINCVLTKNQRLFVAHLLELYIKHKGCEMEMFERQIGNGYIIEMINLSTATFSEAARFKKQLETDIDLGYKVIIVDFSNCSLLDSAFMGVLVITLKRLLRLNGTIKIIKPGLFSNPILNLTGTIEIFELYESVDNAIASISISPQNNNDSTPRELDQLTLANQH